MIRSRRLPPLPPPGLPIGFGANSPVDDRQGHKCLRTAMGLDDASLTGAPTQMLVSKIGDLQIPAAILVDEAGFQQLWPGETFGRQESD